MQITINVPDTLPQERLKQRIKELEQSLITEARFFAVNHDHYLSGVDKP